MNYILKENANTNHDDGEEMYNSYGAHITDHETDRDYDMQTIEYSWLDQEDDELLPKLLGQTEDPDNDEYYICDNEYTVQQLLDLARSVRADMDKISATMDRAVEAYESGDLELTIECLEEAQYLETEHGDNPSTSELRDKLLDKAAKKKVEEKVTK